MKCLTCFDEPCTCRAVVSKPPVREWALRECRVEGCHVVIRERLEVPGPAFCKWHLDGQPHQMKARDREPTGPLITKEEFGMPLFEAIKCCTGILQLREMQETADPKRLKDYQVREAIMLKQLAALVPKLPVSDQEALLERYPRLFA